jgi:hypothetical protein
MLQRLMIHAAVLIALAGLATANAAAGQVVVEFVEPARFSDAGFGEVETGRTVDALTRHLQGFASRLPEGQSLRVEVLDVDLAGWVAPGSRRDVRVLRGGADAPSIRLRYALTSEGRTLLAGEDRLTDLGYLSSSALKQTPGEYGHELRLLDDWFKERFAAR